MSRENRSILFVDVCGSTKVLETLGDERGRGVLLSCLAVLRRAGEAGGGTVLDQIGDELMLSFPDALSAARTACAMQSAVAKAALDRVLPPGVYVRVGFHHGPVEVHAEGIFGKTVHLARRLASISKSQQIVTSRQTVELLEATGIARRYLDLTHVKGHDEPLEVYEILWDESLGTQMNYPFGPPLQQRLVRRLLVTHGDLTLEMGPTRPAITLGRGEHCDLVIEHVKVSRLHGHFEFRKNGYFFVDASANGSHVALSDQVATFVRRDEAHLVSDGSIQLGGTDADAPTVRFTLREEMPAPDGS